MRTATARKDPTKLQTLILNADHRPLSTWPLSMVPATVAVHAFYRDRVNIVENWEGAFLRSPSITVAVPKVVALREYAPVRTTPKFCRRSILLRDRYRCQYCGEKFPTNELTFDHYVPRSKGGKTVWANILTACIWCNAKKADQHLQPRALPRQPTSAELLQAGLEFLPNQIRQDFGSFIYWNVPLDP
jgi:5-methylcytosine-specific restriction endonuclease McrA